MEKKHEIWVEIPPTGMLVQMKDFVVIGHPEDNSKQVKQYRGDLKSLTFFRLMINRQDFSYEPLRIYVKFHGEKVYKCEVNSYIFCGVDTLGVLHNFVCPGEDFRNIGVYEHQLDQLIWGAGSQMDDDFIEFPSEQ